jgi:hypothetical protein
MMNLTQIAVESFYTHPEYKDGFEEVLDYIRLNIIAKPSKEKECVAMFKCHIRDYLQNMVISNEILDFDIEQNENNFLISVKESFYETKRYEYSFYISLDERVSEWMIESRKYLHNMIDEMVDKALKEFDKKYGL